MAKPKNRQQVLPDREKAEKLYNAQRAEYQLVLDGIHQQLQTLTEQAGLALTIKYRVKRFDTYCEKLGKLIKQQGSDLIQITDLLGIRIICPFLDDLVTVEQLLADNFEVVEMEHKAEQHSFREFGYDSVHMLIRTHPISRTDRLPHSSDVCEVQLRTILQEAWAEVEHELVYKSDIPLPNDSIRRKLASLNASLTLSDLIFQEIRDYQKEIRKRGRQRRQSLEDSSCNTSAIDISQLPELPQEDEVLDSVSALPLASMTLEKMMYKALEAHSNNQFVRAISLYANLLRHKLVPKIRSLIYNHRGMAWFALAENQKALEDFNKAIQFDEENIRAWKNRGLVNRVAGKYDQSLEDYQQAIDRAPQQIDGYWGRAQTCYEMKLYSRALNDCHKVLARQEDFAPAQELEKALRRKIF